MCSTSSFASDGFYCDDCSTAEIESKLRSLNTGEYNVVDMENGLLKKYYVVSEYIGHVPFSYIEERVPEDVDVQKLNQALNAFNNLENAIRNYSNSTHSSGIDSVWELSGDRRKQNQLAEQIADEQSILDFLTTFIQLNLEITGIVPDSQLVIKHFLPNGGYVIYEIIGIIGSELELRLIRIVDADKNEVPITEAQFSSKYTFIKENVSGIAGATKNFSGSFVINGATSFMGGGKITTSCVQESDRLVCYGRVE